MKTDKQSVITIGVYVSVNFSIIHCIGVFSFPASCVMSTNLLIVESIPVFKTFIYPVPFKQIVPHTSLLHLDFATGLHSPVKMDSSMFKPCPSTSNSHTSPSTGILLPGLIKTLSPITKSSTLTISSFPKTSHTVGCRFFSNELN